LCYPEEDSKTVLSEVKNSVHYLTNKLESVQAEAARVVTGGTHLVSLSKLYAETGWEYLKDRREKCLCSDTMTTILPILFLYLNTVIVTAGIYEQ
jgi:hypothetical protein